MKEWLLCFAWNSLLLLAKITIGEYIHAYIRRSQQSMRSWTHTTVCNSCHCHKPITSRHALLGSRVIAQLAEQWQHLRMIALLDSSMICWWQLSKLVVSAACSWWWVMINAVLCLRQRLRQPLLWSKYYPLKSAQAYWLVQLNISIEST